MKSREQLTADLTRVKRLALGTLEALQAKAADEQRPLTECEYAEIAALITEGNALQAALDGKPGAEEIA